MKKLSKGQRKFVRLEKARIRRNFSDKPEQEKQIGEMYQTFEKQIKGQSKVIPSKEPKMASEEKPVEAKEVKKEKKVSKNKEIKKNDNSGNIQPGDK